LTGACWRSPAWAASNGPTRRHDEAGTEEALVPLIVETLILCAAGFLIAFGLSSQLFRRRRRQSFLEE
jgi:hypothetical protein